jgi:hypothetical protein
MLLSYFFASKFISFSFIFGVEVYFSSQGSFEKSLLDVEKTGS